MEEQETIEEREKKALKKAEQKKRTFLVRTKQCRHCQQPFATTSNVQVVHPECRQAYYRTKAKEYSNTKGTNRPCFRERDRRTWFINEVACEACGNKEINKNRKFFHKVETEPGVFVIRVKQHILCPTCIMKYRFGLLEALTWKPIALATPTTVITPMSL